ncbi:hypothetical protein EC973_006479 [Apophysomyces ossiformis]|uniref:Uncharacterized protein n=1 Tax=Apophysomyces ossiformis TaxID=679940 RepID=A0A8H7BEC4_9FUNG|nr:hypothetical protein EC973_006479 [Apophysomyces ossiformis]
MPLARLLEKHTSYGLYFVEKAWERTFVNEKLRVIEKQALIAEAAKNNKANNGKDYELDQELDLQDEEGDDHDKNVNIGVINQKHF